MQFSFKCLFIYSSLVYLFTSVNNITRPFNILFREAIHTQSLHAKWRHTPVPTVVVIQICFLYSQCRLYSSQNIRASYVIYFCSGNSRGVLHFELWGMVSIKWLGVKGTDAKGQCPFPPLSCKMANGRWGGGGGG